MAPLASAITTATRSDSKMRLKSSVAMAEASGRAGELLHDPEEVVRCGMQRGLPAAHRGQDLPGDHLAQLDAELVERVHAPHHALNERLVLVERQQRAQVG